MAKVLFFSDFHAHLFEEFAKPDAEYVNDRFRAQIVTLQKVFDLARENGATLVFGGDLFHKRAKLDDFVFNEVYNVFAKNSDVPTYLVRGNHDSRTNQVVTRHWLETFKHLEHVYVSDVPEQLVVEDMYLYTLPYTDDVEYLKGKLKDFAAHAEKEESPTLLVPHVGVDGSEVGKYSHRLEGAFSVEDMRPDAFDYVAMGHYHKRQFLDGRDNIFYAGNTIQNSFSDEGQEKGVFLIDFERGGKPDFIPIANKNFITIREIDEDTQRLVDSNYVRFILNQEQAQEVEIFKGESDNIRVEVQKEYNTETRLDIDVTSSEVDIVRTFAKEHYPESEDLAVQVLKEVT